MEEPGEKERNNYFTHMINSKDAQGKLKEVREIAALKGDTRPPKRIGP